jgi:hypothetical protein
VGFKGAGFLIADASFPTDRFRIDPLSRADYPDGNKNPHPSQRR